MTLSLTGKTESLNLIELFEEFMVFWQELSAAVTAHITQDEALVNEEGQNVKNVEKHIHQQLIQFIEKQQQQVDGAASAVQLQLYQQHLYAACAVIDEQILEHFPVWDLQQQWYAMMLESALFKSRNAGSRLIEQMESLANITHNFSPDEQDLALIYVRIIWLGFDGKYATSPKKLKSLQDRLLNAAEISTVDVNENLLFDEAYRCNINPQTQSRLAPFSVWRRYLGYAVVTYFLVTAVLWFAYTDKLRTDLICELSNSGRFETGVNSIAGKNNSSGKSADTDCSEQGMSDG